MIKSAYDKFKLERKHRDSEFFSLQVFGSYVQFSISGSPADKDNLEVGDEILEVNGKTLEDATHTEVISHIHQVCI